MDRVIRLFCKRVPALEARDIGYRFEDVDGFLQKREDICRKELDPVLIEKIYGNLAMVEPVHPELEDLCCKLFFRATAERGVPAGAPQEIIEKSKDLFPDTIVQRIVINPGGKTFEHVSGKCQLGKAISREPF